MLAQVVYIHTICAVLQCLAKRINALRPYNCPENVLCFLLHLDLLNHNKNVRSEVILMDQLGSDCSLHFDRVSDKPDFWQSDGLPTLDYSDIDR